MGKAIGALTKTGLGDSVDSAQYFDKPQQAFAAANNNLAQDNYGDPGMSFSRGDVSVDPVSGQPGYTIDENGDAPPPNITGGNLKPNFLPNNKQLPDIQKPNFLQASQTPGQKGMTKGGTLLNILVNGLAGAGAAAGSYSFGEGFGRATGMAQRKQQIINQQKQQEIENQRQQQEEKRRQQEADQQAGNYKSESDLRAQQVEESKAKVGAKDRNPKEVYDDDIKNGLTPAQALEHAYNIKAPVVSERNPTEDSLAYTAENDADPDKRKAASAALERITKNKIRVSAAGRAASEGDKEDKRRFDADVTGYYGHVISQGGDTSGAENILKERLKDPKLTPYQKQVASETLRRVRQEQQSALR